MMSSRWLPIARIAHMVAMIIAGVTVSSLTDTAAMPSHHAACEGASVTTDITIATEAVLKTTALRFPPGNLIRTTSQLTLPTGARWDTCLARGSLVLTVESGALQVTVAESFARVVSLSASALGAPSLRELATGEAMVLGPGNRLILHGHGRLVAQHVGQGAAVAEVIRVS